MSRGSPMGGTRFLFLKAKAPRPDFSDQTHPHDFRRTAPRRRLALWIARNRYQLRKNNSQPAGSPAKFWQLEAAGPAPNLDHLAFIDW